MLRDGEAADVVVEIEVLVAPFLVFWVLAGQRHGAGGFSAKPTIIIHGGNSPVFMLICPASVLLFLCATPSFFRPHGKNGTAQAAVFIHHTHIYIILWRRMAFVGPSRVVGKRHGMMMMMTWREFLFLLKAGMGN